MEETKRKLNERLVNIAALEKIHITSATPATPISEHFNLPGHSAKDTQLILLEIILNSGDSVRKAPKAHLIDKAKTWLGIN